MNLPPRREFKTESDAAEAMYESVNDGCVDNYRFAFENDKEAFSSYNQCRDLGCCGFYDEEILVDGREAVIGCNYDH